MVRRARDRPSTDRSATGRPSADRPTPTPAKELRSDAARNRERLLDAALVTLHRDGPGVPMAAIAAEASVGVGTLYRHFATREELLDELTRRSFELMLDRMDRARTRGGTATDVLRTFLVGVVADRDLMVLPSTGGPTPVGIPARDAQARLHDAIHDVLAGGRADGTIRRDVEIHDIAWLGATLAQPGRPGDAWDAVCRRMLDTYLAGLAVPD